MPARVPALPARLTALSARRYVQAWRQAAHAALIDTFDSHLMPAEPAALHGRIADAISLLEEHAQIEQRCFYPLMQPHAPGLVDEARIEHTAMAGLIAPLKDPKLDDRRRVTRFKVLCEYLRHHVAEEDGPRFAALEAAPVAWVDLARALPALAPAKSARARRPEPPSTGIRPDRE